MNKKKVDFTDYANNIVKAIPKGILLTTAAEGEVNTMTIGWRTLGTNWGMPVFAAYVREHRHTMKLLKKNPEFTINVPLGDFDRNIVGVCGTTHGDEVDKIQKLGLTLVDSDKVQVPGIAELPLTLECRVMYMQLQDKELYEAYGLMGSYPQDVDERAYGRNCDAHYTIFGEIVNAYIIENE